MSISSSVTWYTLPNNTDSRKYILLSDLATQLTLQYFLFGNSKITASWNLLSGSSFANWFTSYICGGGWDPVKAKSNVVYYISWKCVLEEAIRYVTPTLSNGQVPGDMLTVQIAQALLDDFGDVFTYVALQQQV